MHKNAYTAKSLIGNWHENRHTDDYDELANGSSNTYLKNASHSKYVPVSKSIGNNQQYQKQNFGGATQNVINFQADFKADETFKTTSQVGFGALEDRKDPFVLKDTGLTKDKAELAKYQAEWSGGNHNFARTYIGAKPFTKSQQE